MVLNSTRFCLWYFTIPKEISKLRITNNKGIIMKNKMMLLLTLIAASSGVVVASDAASKSDAAPKKAAWVEGADAPAGYFNLYGDSDFEAATPREELPFHKRAVNKLKNRYDFSNKKRFARNVTGDVMNAGALGLLTADIYKRRNNGLEYLLNNTALGQSAIGNKYLRKKWAHVLASLLQTIAINEAAGLVSGDGGLASNGARYAWEKAFGKKKKPALFEEKATDEDDQVTYPERMTAEDADDRDDSMILGVAPQDEARYQEAIAKLPADNKARLALARK